MAKTFLTAFKISLPAFFCYIPLGMVYGALCTQQEFPWYYPPLFSTFVLAGAMQFVALPLLAAGSSLLTIALAIIPLGFRNIFYGLTMLERYRPIPWWLRFYLAHGLVDTTYSMLNSNPSFPDKKEDIRFITQLTVLIHVYWVVGSLLGSFLIKICPLPPGLEFSLTAFFAAAAVEQFLKKKEWKAPLIALASICLALVIFPGHFFLGAIACAILCCLALPQRESRCA